MKAAKFIDHDWQQSIDLLSRGESVFLCASENYGTQYFLQTIRNSDYFPQHYQIVNINHLKDSEILDYQHILNLFQDPLNEQTCLLANNPYDFINALDTL